MDQESLASSVLAGIRVLDLTRVRSGPTAVRQLADWGADVIKLELPLSLQADGALGAKRDTPDFQNLHRLLRRPNWKLRHPEHLVWVQLIFSRDLSMKETLRQRIGVDVGRRISTEKAIQ